MHTSPLFHLNELPADELCNYIQKKHHATARKLMHLIEQSYSKFFAELNVELKFAGALRSLLGNFNYHLEKHFIKEETILFPFIKKIVCIKNGASKGCFPLGIQVSSPLKVMSQEYIYLLEEVRKISKAFSQQLGYSKKSQPLVLCALELANLETELKELFSIEEEILHPKLKTIGTQIEEEIKKKNE